MTIQAFFVCLSLFLLGGVLITYLYGVSEGGDITASNMTWFTAFLAMTMNCATMIPIHKNNLWEIAIPASATVGSLIVLIVASKNERGWTHTWTDGVAMNLIFIAGMLLFINKNPVLSNLCTQAALLFVLVPMHVKLLTEGPVIRESWMNIWGTALLGYVFYVLAIATDENPSAWYEYIHVMINGVALNSCISAATIYRESRATKKES